jgi:hypothetical protein
MSSHAPEFSVSWDSILGRFLPHIFAKSSIGCGGVGFLAERFFVGVFFGSPALDGFLVYWLEAFLGFLVGVVRHRSG